MSGGGDGRVWAWLGSTPHRVHSGRGADDGDDIICTRPALFLRLCPDDDPMFHGDVERRGVARRGVARPGVARRGVAGLGVARDGDGRERSLVSQDPQFQDRRRTTPCRKQQQHPLVWLWSNQGERRRIRSL